ncbi:hypothetical protein A2625_07880 [candidate division WOR-1 bacterium RIFCSPHIGHO2_01_FULL_53_15]|uniref:Uncharacterized protein n=1 Tax=candidate division WOR-1 bacterium RIFCSPHIGHO2_01_FULL_53_15 TaxID=1802564 RepID=A0A1F4Q032_UNCSA|nr:MAG: hypothetical protein A2625_07880 [candidate division WOR-1 bacterium RIFCSPHIGHO2_01_FULL_53_15]OGC12629.1 MAG: hypothetical protein A3D23_02660 [candidate division WOR-1 bacterium RIFCSPHIGHO2_02_FULL_53_26]
MIKSKPKVKKSTVAISERNRVALAYLELARDKVFQKLSEEDKVKIIKEAQAIGVEAAGWVATEYGMDDPRKIAVKMGLRVFGEDKQSGGTSEYRREKKEIVISRKFHEKLLREVQSAELSERLLKLVVAQQLFHHLEAERIGEVYKRFKFPVWRIGSFVREKTIRGLSDVAAQAFTQTLLGLEISPQVFDYLVLSRNLL